MSKDDLHYLRSILAHMREMRRHLEGCEVRPLGMQVLADNIDWLDCFIERNDR